MPRPNPGESEQDYVGRFMASAEARKDFPDEKQRAAVAYSMFKEKKNSAFCPNCDHEKNEHDTNGKCTVCDCLTCYESKNASDLCRDCGSAMLGNADHMTCTECGLETHGEQATPPIESLRNICPFCRHQLEPEHDALGCHAEGCTCTEKLELIVGPEDVLPNAGEPGDSDIQAAQRGLNMLGMSVPELRDLISEFEPKGTFASKAIVAGAKQMMASKKRMGAENANADPAKKWAVLDRPGRESVMKAAGVGGYAYHEFDEIYSPHAKKLAEVLERENSGDINDLDPAMGRMWDEASDAEKRRCVGMAGLGIGIIQFRWSQMPDSAKAALKKKVFDIENRNAEPSESQWKDSTDYEADGGCKKCGWGAPGTGHSSGYHKADCKTLEKERKKFEHLQGTERRNSTPICSACLSACPNPTEANAEEAGGKIHLKRTADDGSGHWEAYCGINCCENRNTDTCQTCASGAFFSSYKKHEGACAQCGSASSEGALCAEGRKLYDAMEHDHVAHEARNRKETVAEAFARLKLEAEKWWDEHGHPDRDLALKRAGLPTGTEDVKLAWSALPAASRKAIIEAMNDGYRHEVNNAGKLPAGWSVYPASEFKDADGERPDWATKNFYVLDSATNPVGEGDTREAAIADALAHRPRQNADPKADQAASIAARLRDILAAHGSAMIRKRGSSTPITVKSAAEAGDLSQVTDVDVPQGVSNGTGQGPRHKDLFKEWYELDKKQDELTRQLHDLEYDTGAGGRDSDPKRAPLLAEMKRVEQALGAIMAKDTEERRNARGSELAKKLGVAHPKDLPFDQINEHGCNGCDDIRAPLNADGYCKQCAAEQGAFVNAKTNHEWHAAKDAYYGHYDACEACQRDEGCSTGSKLFVKFNEEQKKAEGKNAGGFPLSYFKRPESKDRADQVGIEDMEDEDLTPAGLKAKREALAEIGGLDNSVSGIQHVGADQRQADGEAVYGSRR